MKNLTLILLMLFFGKVSAKVDNLNLIPRPVEVNRTDGAFKLTEHTSIIYNSQDVVPLAGMLLKRINTATGFNIQTGLGKERSIRLVLNNNPDKVIGTEGYRLEVTENGISISANEPAGLFYGIQTLLQLFPGEIEGDTPTNMTWEVPCVKITDYPRFRWRGLMLDVSRNFFSKEDVKSYIDEMSRFKFNTFHWHLTDDNGWRIEIKSLPKLTSVGAWRVPRAGVFGERSDPKPGEAATCGGFYTQDDIKEIVTYAQERFITIVPEIDIPGHSMAAIAAYPELSCTKNPDTKVNPGTNFAEWYNDGTFKMLIENTLNPSDEKVYEFLDKVFTEIAAIFPNPYIHVGGDECYKGYWEKDSGCVALMKKENFDHVEQLQGYFMNRVEKILNAKGKKLIGWDEILDGGISPGATVMSWRGMAGGIKAAKMGHDVVMTPTTFTYLDYTQGDPTVDPPIYASLRLKTTYSFEPVPADVDPKYILGGQGNLWTEHIPSLRSAEYMTYPRAWALAEVFWSPHEIKQWNGFIKRVENQFKRSDIGDKNYSRAIYDPIIRSSRKEGKLWLIIESEVPDLDIYYSIDETMPDDHSLKYSGPVELPDGPIVLRVISWRNGKPLGHLITLALDQLRRRSRN
jgi:hexosaminidase